MVARRRTTPERTTPGIGFNDAAGRYVNQRSGRFVAQATVKDALNATIAAAGDRIADITAAMRNGNISLAQWQLGMADAIKSSHLAASALANGGWAQMTQADYGRVGQAVRAQYDYLNRFANQIASGQQRMDGTLNRRADMYADAARTTYEATVRAEMRLRGYDQERSVRHVQDSCASCISAAAAGWSPLGSLPLPGRRDCYTNCKCTLEYRRAA